MRKRWKRKRRDPAATSLPLGLFLHHLFGWPFCTLRLSFCRFWVKSGMRRLKGWKGWKGELGCKPSTPLLISRKQGLTIVLIWKGGVDSNECFCK